MSLNIWHELDHPQRPLHKARSQVLSGAEEARDRAAHLGLKYDQALGLELENIREFPVGSVDEFLGRVIGIRAAVLGRDVSSMGSSGFEVSGSELTIIRAAKNFGTAFESGETGDFSAKFAQGVHAIGEHYHPTDAPTANLGLAIGLRYVELSPIQGLPEREAA